MVEINGDIDLSNVASLSKAINLKGLENLYKLDNSSSYSGYPAFSNYYKFDEQRMKELEARARGMAKKHTKLSEEQIAKIQRS